MKISRTLPFKALLLASTIVGSSASAAATDYPSKPIQMIVPFSAGGTSDFLARTVAEKLGASLDTTVVVDNRPGAGGNIGSAMVARAKPDGYTLLLGTVGTHAINQSVYKEMSFDAVKDFAPISLVAAVPNILVANPALQANSVQELIALAKQKPGQITFASSGNGSSIHLSGEMFKSLTGVDMLHVPYKGSGPAVIDLLGGQVDIMFDNMPSALPHVQAGKLKAFAVTTGERSEAAPELPTIAEEGVKGYEATAWFGILAPAGTPTDIVAKLNAEIVKILDMPDVKKRLAGQGAKAVSNSPEEFASYIKAELKKWENVVKSSGFQPI
ncbi:Bug family tripartite tricarboxylate transporter substrate binding protein [Pollutimonas harenae]|uniref:Tripartite tricarboxylate transporter substrate binding protein n=1 Tax=Pollutimonas harenae TaxID=657015 RepID=A0A853H9M2_9BURK|nr:tripartite tricarboxylate transporter substrate binding protein [Pollutimonas harenae]NYT86734.1 tripartite tricarboxylate transporter substrate binding protein [Pollutimonas harenae]TEA71383.1 tripartite tricarboxylate transporter substrate binding protein [Pollutimonas harenae]